MNVLTEIIVTVIDKTYIARIACKITEITIHVYKPIISKLLQSTVNNLSLHVQSLDTDSRNKSDTFTCWIYYTWLIYWFISSEGERGQRGF